jgi:DNA modification methylase
MNQKTTEVQIKPAKGRPMLTWVGKRPLRNVMAYPAQLVETYGTEYKTNDPQSDIWRDWPVDYPKGGLLFHGDNKDVLAHLLANGFRGKVKLIYIDPPFDSGADYVRKVTLRGVEGTAKLEGEGYTLGEQIQYTDIWANDNYLQFMYERILLMRELLDEDGSIFIHLDHRRVAHVRLILDEIFGEDGFRNEIIWNYRKWGRSDNAFLKNHDTILFYSKYNSNVFNRQYMPLSESTKKRFGGKFQIWADEARTRKITTDDDSQGAFMSDVWEISYIPGASQEKTGFPTQKPEDILERIIKACSNPGDIVLDCFIGSGTTATVAQKLGRRWIGCDINKGAIQTTSRRLSDVLKDQSKVIRAPELLPTSDDQEKQLKPTQLSFTVFRVNDYDLQIQHNEAVNLACKFIGITRTKTDAYFDGVLGKRLVKIIPFNHPLDPLDLEEIKNELANRPEEERDIVVVCLGKELAVDAWIEDWNRLRKQGDFPNRIEVIELRSDPRYGGFFTHQPAQAQVKINRTEKGIEVIIESFISPTIIERLKQQAGLITPQIDDWRAMVDSVMIDTAYDGKVLNVVLADVPEKKSDLVAGKYTLDIPKGETTVAVKITDMLGEEVLITKKI